MINSVFTDTFNFLVSSLNSLNQNSSQSKNTRPSDALKRLIDTVQFIHNKKTTFNTDLKAVREELVQMKSEALKLKNQISNATKNSLVFTVESLIDGLIVEVDAEIEKRERAAEAEAKFKASQKNNTKNPNAVKVKIFKSAFSDVIEKEMNDFLNNNNVEITDKLQSVEKDVICITLFYK
jgi:hypothetical protein